jgi:hypothetical protein
MEEGNVILTIEQIVGRRIRRVRAQKSAPAKPAKTRESNAK